MPKKKYIVDLLTEEREQLRHLITRGKPSARKVARARILLHAADGLTDERIVAALNTGIATVERTRQRFVENKGLIGFATSRKLLILRSTA